MIYDINYFKKNLGKIEGSGNVGQILWENVNAVQVPEKKVDEVSVNEETESKGEAIFDLDAMIEEEEKKEKEQQKEMEENERKETNNEKPTEDTILSTVSPEDTTPTFHTLSLADDDPDNTTTDSKDRQNGMSEPNNCAKITGNISETRQSFDALTPYETLTEKASIAPPNTSKPDQVLTNKQPEEEERKEKNEKKENEPDNSSELILNKHSGDGLVVQPMSLTGSESCSFTDNEDSGTIAVETEKTGHNETSFEQDGQKTRKAEPSEPDIEWSKIKDQKDE